MASLSACLEAPHRRVITLIGSGGKTSLMWLLAGKHGSAKVLVTTTTKMLFEGPEKRPYDYFFSGGDFNPPPSGITLAGMPDTAAGKITPLGPELLEAIIPHYDHVFIEGDGSRGLPLKAWADHEPMVPPYTDATLGVLSLRPLGQPISAEIIHRLPLFLLLTGAREGEILSLGHLVPLITGQAAGQIAGKTEKPAPGKSCGGKGLFSAARGDRILFINQVDPLPGGGDGGAREGFSSLDQARELVSLLPASCTLQRIAAGSVFLDQGVILG
jgi:probable selenium-dependent hydroxylase accessory protein YqeC